jgi:streptogramin lyase
MRSTTAFGLISAMSLYACGGGSNGRGSAGGDDGIGSVSLSAGTGDDDGTAGDDGDGGTGQSGADEGVDGSDEEGAKFDLGAQPDASLGCDGGGGGNGGGVADFSYIWIANSAESTVSKINTESLIEEGRYITRPDSNGNPSRTSVNLNGDAVIANRSGGVTMIFARHEDCPNAANTSSGSADVKAWQDGCIGWHTPMAYASQRPVAWSAGVWDEGTCRYDETKVWTSGANATIDVLLLDGETGVIEQTVPIAGVQPNFYGIYGGAVDSGDNFWGTQLSGGQLIRVDRLAFTVQTWQTPAGGYGMAVDRNDRVWTCSSQVGRFDYPSQTWLTGQAGGSGGCMPDGGDLLWLANDPMVAVDIDTLAVVQTLDVPSYVHGVSIDFNGYVWGPAINNNEAYRVDPASGQVDVVPGLNLPYTYSDMTGFGLSQVGGPSG